jgi:hypothetical protein
MTVIASDLRVLSASTFAVLDLNDRVSILVRDLGETIRYEIKMLDASGRTHWVAYCNFTAEGWRCGVVNHVTGEGWDSNPDAIIAHAALR